MLARYKIEHIGDLLLPTDPDGVRRLLDVAWYKSPWVPSFVLPDIHANMFCSQVDQKRELLEEVLRRITDPPEITSLRQKTMLIWGQNDPLFPVEIAYRMQRALGPNTVLSIIKKAAHTPNLERHKSFNASVKDFLSAQ